jgi:hypothetical protein
MAIASVSKQSFAREKCCLHNVISQAVFINITVINCQARVCPDPKSLVKSKLIKPKDI